MTLKNKKEQLGTLVNKPDGNGNMMLGNISVYYRMYRPITDWDKVMQIEQQVIEPLEKIQATHDKKLKQFQAEIEKDKSRKDEVNKAYNEMLSTEQEFKLALIDEEDAKKAGFNVFEYRQVKDYISKNKE